MADLLGVDVQGGNTPIVVSTSVETFIIAGQQVTIPFPTGKAVVHAWVELTVGTGTTAVSLAIYRGPAIAGAPVYAKQAETGDFQAGQTARFDLQCIDPYLNQAYVQYCLSITQTGAGSNGTAQEYLIDTRILSG